MLNRAIPFIIAMAAFTVWETVLAKTSLVYYLYIALLIALFVLLLRYNRFRFLDLHFWLLVLPVLLLAVTTSAFILFVQRPLLQQVVIVGVAAIFYLYVTALHRFLFEIAHYTPLTLESIASYLTLVNFLFAAVAFFGVATFLNIHLWYLALTAAVVTYLGTYQLLWVSKVEPRLTQFVSLIVSVLMVEFFWALTFFPTSHFVSGLALTIVYYVIVSMALFFCLNRFDLRTARIYLTIGMTCLFVILLSAKWL